MLLRCQILLEWAAVPTVKGAPETPDAILAFAARLLQETSPLGSSEEKEANRLRAAVLAAQEALNGKK